MNVASALHSRAATGGTDEWITPPEVFNPLADLYRFGVDLAARSATMARVPEFVPPDSLQRSWAELRAPGPGWLNAPYSLASLFLAKCHAEMERGFTTVNLVKLAPDTSAWDRYVLSDERVYVRFIPGRIWYIAGADVWKTTPDGELVLSLAAGERGPCPHASAILVFPGSADVPPPPGGHGRFGVYRVDHYRPARARRLELEVQDA
ncbi:MAG TPA: DNA N-6-adenine-methyltransferase [Polyangiaceae bacterium]|nr:DNA N-6-adenine-methyltransferase [Polyangiaceae bacterium]